jgi:hypothetical protein
LDYITSGRFKILRQDVYAVNYPFDDKTALYAYLIKNYMMEPDECAIEKMRGIIGYKKNDRPIIIQDAVNIFLIEMA